MNSCKTACLVLALVFSSYRGECGAEKETHELGNIDIRITQDGKYAITLSEIGLVSVWETATGERLHKFQMKQPSGDGFEVHPSKETILLSAGDGFLEWDWQKKKSPELLIPDESKQVLEDSRRTLNMSISGTGKDLVFFHDTGAIKLLHLPTGLIKDIIQVRVARHFCSRVVLQPKSNVLFVTNQEEIQMVNVETKQLIATLKGHRRAVRSMHLSPNGQYLLTGGYDNDIRIWSVPERKAEKILTMTDGSTARYSPDGTIIACADSSGLVVIHHSKDYREIRRWQGPRSGIVGIAVTPNNKSVLTIGEEAYPRYWSVETGKEMRQSKDKK